jgi:branched-chain amino acid transport system permease protein
MQSHGEPYWQAALRLGLIGGAAAVLVSLIGMVEVFGARPIVSGVLTLGHALVAGALVFSAYQAASRAQAGGRSAMLLSGGVVGLVVGALLAVLVILATILPLRNVLINASPGMVSVLTFGLGPYLGAVLLLALGAVLGLLAALLPQLTPAARRTTLYVLVILLLTGLLSELLRLTIAQYPTLASVTYWLFAGNGLSLLGAAAVIVVTGLLTWYWPTLQALARLPGAAVVQVLLALPLLVVGFGRLTGQYGAFGLIMVGALIVVMATGAVWLARRNGAQQADRARAKSGARPPGPRREQMAAQWAWLVVLLLLPVLLGAYPSEVLDQVGLYALMGLGLNIVVGFAGLLDLGYVAFFALGAYAVGIMTSPEVQLKALEWWPAYLSWWPSGIAWWAAVPFAILVAIAAGVLLGIPVLRTRGDYLAIVTLGFGEIIRYLALSDWLRSALDIGGAQGIAGIGKPIIGSFIFRDQIMLFYLLLIGVLLAAFVSVRLRDSRLGRAWMAMREDEDVAEAIGINLVATKLLAFATGAAFSGLSGAIFATKLGSIYPHSFGLLVSINVLALIIIGGMGSIPGVIVGAAVLVGLPELLREFAEFRLMVYGAVLMVMMLYRPEGLWPEAAHQRELHVEENLAAEEAISRPTSESPMEPQAVAK